MGRYHEHKCKNPECTNMTTNKSYCCQSCRSKCINKGRKRPPVSEDTRAKMKESHKRENLSEETRRRMSESQRKKVLSEDTKRKISESVKGENNPFYGESHTDESRYKISESLRKTFEEDNPPKPVYEYQVLAYTYYEYECSLCGVQDTKLLVHHLDGDHNNNSIENLCWLCRSCHNRVHNKHLREGHYIDEYLTQEIRKNRKINKGGEIHE